MSVHSSMTSGQLVFGFSWVPHAYVVEWGRRPPVSWGGSPSPGSTPSGDFPNSSVFPSIPWLRFRCSGVLRWPRP